jgi:protein-S-isoprenylcysteine O-methyltransferase Ste14
MHAIIQAIFRAPITLMVAKVYVPILFPLTFLIALTAIKIDSFLGFPTMFEYPTNWIVAVFSFIIGFALWIWTYEQLTRLGEGSPSPTAGRTIKLVKTGIYAHSRNPSIFGKLFGVIAVGFALNSISFVFILVPLLLTGSLIEKVWRQEPQLVEIFGKEYETYRKDVPLFFPWKLFLFGKKKPHTQS